MKDDAVAKRPAAKVVMKRPAKVAKKPSGASTCKNDDDDHDDITIELNPESAGKVLRDRVKAAKFKNMWDALPEPVKEAYNAAGRYRDGSARDRQSLIVNNMFKKKGNKYISMHDSPEFTQKLKQYEDKYNDESNEGLSALLHICV